MSNAHATPAPITLDWPDASYAGIAAEADAIATDGSATAQRLLRVAARNGYECEGVTLPAAWSHPPHERYSTKTVVIYLFDPATDEDGFVAFTIHSDRGQRLAGPVGYNAPLRMRTAMGWDPAA